MEAREVRMAVVPHVDDGVVEAIERGGGAVVDPARANALVWTDPFDPHALGEVLRGSGIGWVQLPFAGIERFFDAGVIDAERTWTCTKGVYGQTTAEHALALLLAAARRLHRHSAATEWSPAPGGVGERSLAGATVVVVGTGGIGSALTRMLEPLGARVVAVNRSGRKLAGTARTVAVGDLHDVLDEAEFVVLAAAYTKETHHLIGASALRRMDRRAWLVNVARGGLVDHDALVEAISSGAIGGAALDVTEPEPLPPGHPLWELDDVLITPHVANTWEMALPELRALVERNVRRFVSGHPLEGLIDPALGY